jgi:hypothetical protein
VSDGLEPIDDGEILYRRVPAAANPTWYDPETEALSDQAFAPHKTEDVSGLSVWRAKYRRIDDIGKPGKRYYVAMLEAGAMRRAGIRVEPSPDTAGGYDPAHAELPDLNSSNRKDDVTLERQRTLVELCLGVEGPFVQPIEPTPD